MKRWIPGWELRERWAQWNISYYDVVDIVVHGELTAHNINHTPICVDIEKQTRDEIEFYKRRTGLMDFTPGGDYLNSCRNDVKENLVKSINLGLDGFLFKITEVEEYERNHGLIPQKTQPEPTDPKKRSYQEEKKRTSEEMVNYFHHKNRDWHVGFQGEKAFFKDCKYIRYISLLLEKPGRTIGALELVHTVDDNISERKSIEQALDEGLSVGKHYRDDEISDKKVRAFEKLLSDIEQETDPMVKRELEEEYKKKETDILKMNLLVDSDGLPARPPKRQKLDDPHRKTAQRAVRKGLDNAYSALNKSGMKKLAKHLKKNIKTAGNYDFCYYDSETPWDIKL